MNDRRRLLVLGILILSGVSLCSVAIAGWHFRRAAFEVQSSNLVASPAECNAALVAPPAILPFARAAWLAAGTTAVIVIAGGTLLILVTNLTMRRLEESESRMRAILNSSGGGIRTVEGVVAPVQRRGIPEAMESSRREVQSAHSMRQLLRTHHELDHFVRSLSHDMSANFMMLENCVQQLKSSCSRHTLPDVLDGVSHVEACLLESKLFLNDLATLAKTGQIDMNPERVEVAHVVKEVLFELEGLLATRGVKTQVAADLPIVWCNETRVRQVLSNLVRNAVTHGCDASHPQITISQLEQAEQGSGQPFVWLRVYDNGPGIPAEYREEVFRPGRRLDSAKSPGSGMGLAIVKQIVEYYGGSITIDPACPSGTAFVLSLPKAAGR